MRGSGIFLAGLVVGLPIGGFLWYAFSPLLFDEVVAETLAEAEAIAIGAFRDADRAHKGQGTARLVALPDGGHQVQLSEFQVTNGPDLEVWLSAHPDPKVSSEVSGTTWASLEQKSLNLNQNSLPLNRQGADFEREF